MVSGGSHLAGKHTKFQRATPFIWFLTMPMNISMIPLELYEIFLSLYSVWWSVNRILINYLNLFCVLVCFAYWCSPPVSEVYKWEWPSVAKDATIRLLHVQCRTKVCVRKRIYSENRYFHKFI